MAHPKSPAGEGPPESRVTAGKITTVHGVKGWVKIHSYTAPEESIFAYQPWWMKYPSGWKKLEIDQYRTIDKGFIAHILGIDDREDARLYCQREIEVSTEGFPAPDENEVYWHQLRGLRVVSRFDGVERLLGVVDGFMETGANDVLIVAPTQGSIDTRERLIPYVADYVGEPDFEAGLLVVDWDPDFETRND